MKYGLTEEQLETIKSFLSKDSSIEEAIIFGSRAIGTFKEASDIDIAVKGKGFDIFKANSLKSTLEEETQIPFFFDIVSYGDIKSEELKKHIRDKGVVVFRKKGEEWSKGVLSEIAEVQTGPFGSQLKNRQYITGGTPVVTVEHIKNFRIIDFDYPSVSVKDKKRLLKYSLKAGDIIFSRVGSVDLSAYVRPHQDGWMFSSRMLRVRPCSIVDSRFLSYFFQQGKFREFILNISVGATMPSINTEILKGIPISYPPLPEQKAIADLLSSLDDKIDLLNRQNQTLEAMAETLFRQWFVEAKEDRWESTTLSEHTEAYRGLSYKGSGLTGKDLGVPMHNLNSIYEGGGYKIEGIKFYKGDYKERHLISPGEIIVSNTEQGHDFKLIGFPAIVPATFGAKGLISQHLYKLIPKKQSYLSGAFVYYLIQSPDIREQIISFTNGSTVNMLAIDGLQRPEFKLPPKSKVTKFTDIVSEYWHKKEGNDQQIQTLQNLRDTLLPKLMSGEVRVDYEP